MKYAALIRGIGPGDPKKSNASLKATLEGLGFQNVMPVISSGNVIFESDIKDTSKLEDIIETAWQQKLGFSATTIVRSEEDLQKVLDAKFFDGLTHTKETYLFLTFFKRPTEPGFNLPFTPEGKPYTLLGFDHNVLYSVNNASLLSGTDIMAWLEKQYSKEITSRTPLTIERILKRMQLL